jgi:hypothetical protein
MLATVAFAPRAIADSFTLGSGYANTTLNGQYVVGGISGSTLDGNSIGSVICDDSANESYLGTTWSVNVNPLAGPWTTSPMFATAGVATYEEAAILGYEMTLSAANQYEQNVLQAAVWDLFHPGSGATITGLPAGADSSTLAWASGEVNDFNYNGSEIITPTGSGNENQEFLLTEASPVPEPPSGSLTMLGLLLGMLSIGSKLLRKPTTLRQTV